MLMEGGLFDFGSNFLNFIFLEIFWDVWEYFMGRYRVGINEASD